MFNFIELYHSTALTFSISLTELFAFDFISSNISLLYLYSYFIMAIIVH